MPTVSRRRFITGAAATVAAGTLIGASSTLTGCGEGSNTASSGDTNDTIFKGACRGNCAGGCFLDIHVRNGQVVRTTAADLPNPAYNRVCTRGLTHVGRIYSSKRLQYPMKRSGEKGSGQFTRISWDEAIQTIVEKWQGYVKQYGTQSIVYSYGSGNYACLSGQGGASSGALFKAVLGMSTLGLDVDAAHGYAFSHITGSHVFGTENEPSDYENSKTFICWGANPPISQPQIMHFIFDMKEKGGKYVVIDPMYGPNAAKADKYISVYPSTDGVLAMGVINHIVANNWVDTDFMMNHTEAPFLIKEDGKLLRGSDIGVKATTAKDPLTGLDTVVDPYVVYDDAAKKAVLYTALTASSKPRLQNVPAVKGMKVQTSYEKALAAAAEYTDAKVTALTGVSAADIQELARIYHEDGPVNTYAMFGDNHYLNGHYNYWPIYLVSALTGNIGKPGAGCGFSEVLAAYLANAAGIMATVGANGKPAQGASPILLLQNQMNNVLDTGKLGETPITVKSLYVTNANIAATMTDSGQTHNWMKKVEFMVVCDMNMTETCMYADILLPAAHWFEQEDLFNAYSSNPYMILQDKAIDPLYEAKTDYEIYKLIADGMGYKGFFDRTPEEYIKVVVGGPAAQAAGVTWEGLQKTHCQNQFANDGGDPLVAFKDGTFATPTGRMQVYRDTAAPTYATGPKFDLSKELTLYWEPAKYADPASAARTGKYPFYCLSEHMRTRTHTQWWECDYQKEYEPQPYLRMNPADAAALGLADGDQAKITSQFGTALMPVALSQGLPPKTCSSQINFNAFEYTNGDAGSGFATLCTNEYCQTMANQSFNDLAVAIEKA
jgi:anaerobic selenocysteine-containing dehydrogenase